GKGYLPTEGKGDISLLHKVCWGRRRNQPTLSLELSIRILMYPLLHSNVVRINQITFKALNKTGELLSTYKTAVFVVHRKNETLSLQLPGVHF
uniref:Uncharacterized protein n=1 Tax=Terrapene triunguis TaxID=2587831 RepID=A0A674JZB3_9SAUR